MVKMQTLVMACLIVLSNILAVACAQDRATITIDHSNYQQVMRGWEVTADMTDDDHPEAVSLYREQLYDMAVADIGIDRLRLEIRSGAESDNKAWKRFSSGEISYEAWRPLRYPTVNDNNDPRVIDWTGFDFSELDDTIEAIVLPMKRRVEARGEHLFINLCYVAFTVQITEGNYEHADPEEYGEFVLATYLHVKEKYGFTPDSWEVLLEPDNGTRQWNPTIMGEAVAAASKRLKENGFIPAFVAPSTTDMAHAVPWIEAIARVPGAMENIVEFSYHRYRNSSAENAKKIAAIGDRFGKSTSMLEWWFKNGTYKVLWEDLVKGKNASWQGQVIRTLFDVNFANPEKPTVSIASDTRMNLQYFRYIRFGAQRIGALSTDPDNTRPTAFVNRDESLVIVVDTKGPVTMTIRGATEGKYSVSYALDERSVLEPEPVLTDANGDLIVRMPGRGVITVRSAVLAKER